MKRKDFTKMAEAVFESWKAKSDDNVFEFTLLGITCIAFLYVTTEGEVTSYQLFAGFAEEYSVENANEWNTENRFVKIYRAGNKRLAIEMDILLPKTFSSEFLNDARDVWGRQLSRIYAKL